MLFYDGLLCVVDVCTVNYRIIGERGFGGWHGKTTHTRARTAVIYFIDLVMGGGRRGSKRQLSKLKYPVIYIIRLGSHIVGAARAVLVYWSLLQTMMPRHLRSTPPNIIIKSKYAKYALQKKIQPRSSLSSALIPTVHTWYRVYMDMMSGA